MKLDPQTALIHTPRKAPQYIETVQPPIFRASTIIFKDTSALFDRHWTDEYDYSYGTHGTPTTYTLGDQIAQIEGGNYCLLAPSGLSAINLVNSCFLSHGDEVWVADNIYGPNMEHLNNLQSRYGIDVKIYNALDVESFQPSKKAKLIWLEAVGSVTLEFPDLINLVKKAKALNILTVLDNTWGAGIAFRPFDFSDEHLGVDVSVHALTKYPSGGGDILMGSVVTRDKNLHHKLLRMHAIQGISISGDDAAQVQRSLASMHIRYEHQSQSTLEIIEWLKSRTEFAQVLHPTLPENVGHQYWSDVCLSGKSAGLVSVIFKDHYDFAAIRKFCDHLKLFKIGFSWGGPVSLAVPYDLKKMRVLETPHLKDGFLVRLCIGLENPHDLIQDIENALNKLN